MRKLQLLLILVYSLTEVQSQDLVFSEPIKLGSQINSADEELGVLVTPDGSTMYFSRAFHANNTGGKFAGTDIWVSKKDATGQWLPAANMGSKWNNKRSNSVIGINKDNTVVYLLNAYSNKSGISFSKFYSGEWQAPEFVPIPGINRDDFVGLYANPSFDVILLSMKGKDSYGEEDLYVSLKDSFGNWTEPKNLGPTINTKDFEISPFLTEDKKRLFFSSKGHGGFGDADIFYCDRLYDSWETWGAPKNLGDKVNSSAFEGYFFLHDSIGYFSSTRLNGPAEIYKTSKVEQERFVRSQNDAQYLSKEEVRSLVQVEPELIFEKGTSYLTEINKLILKKIFLAVSNKKEVRCTLIALKPSGRVDLELYQNRLLTVLDYLKTLGLEGSRVSLGLEDENTTEKERVKIRFSK